MYKNLVSWQNDDKIDNSKTGRVVVIVEVVKSLFVQDMDSLFIFVVDKFWEGFFCLGAIFS